MKRIWILLCVVAFLLVGVFFLLKNKKDPNASGTRAESNFKIENTMSIGRILLTQKNGSRADLKRVDDHWTINDTHKARQSTVDFLLKGIATQHLDHIPGKSANENIFTTMAVSGIHVDIYDLKGNSLLSYTVGGVTQDEYVTYFLKDGSKQPYALMQPGFDGNLRQRYSIPAADWRDVRFWMEDNEKIDSIIVDYPQQRQHAFKLYKKGVGYEVDPLYNTTPIQKGNPSNIAKSYLVTLSGLACEDFLTDLAVRDSILQTEPFMDMKITYPDKTSRIRFYPVGAPSRSPFSAPVNRFYIDYENRDFMIGQYEVIKGAFRSYDYFFGK